GDPGRRACARAVPDRAAPAYHVRDPHRGWPGRARRDHPLGAAGRACRLSGGGLRSGGAVTTIEFLSYLRSREIKLWVEGDQLRYGAPKGALTPELRTQLLARKAELIAFLRQTTGAAHAAVQPIPHAPRSQPLPLSFAQQRLWFLHQLTPSLTSYHIPAALRLSG